MENNRGESDFQQEMEKLLFQKVCDDLQTDQLEANPTLIINHTSGIKIVPDFYSEEKRIIGEIHTHMGKLKGGQPDKIASDILKMMLFEEVHGKKFSKYIVVCDEKEKEQLTGISFLAEAIRHYDIHVLCLDVGADNYEKLKTTIKDQDHYVQHE